MTILPAEPPSPREADGLVLRWLLGAALSVTILLFGALAVQSCAGADAKGRQTSRTSIYAVWGAISRFCSGGGQKTQICHPLPPRTGV
jgi:hypothetical protein